MAAAIAVQGLGKRFTLRDAARPRTVRQFVEGGWRHMGGRDVWALRDVSFSVEQGEVLGVIGRNGAGKSTLLRLLGGVMRPDEGRVIATDHVNGLLDLNAGMHPDLTGRDNAIATGVLAGLRRHEIEARLDEVTAFAELEDYMDEPVRTYSAGMRLRLGFAVAMQTAPRILLIDEVLAVGDIAFQRKCLDRIGQFRADGCAIILISHDLSQVESLCDRVLWLQNGTTVSLGATIGVVRHYESVMLQETLARTPARTNGDAEGQAHLVLNQNRFGTLENRITRVRFLDRDGAEASQIRSGDALSVQIWVDCIVPLSDLHLSFTITSDKGTQIVDFGTDGPGTILPDRHGSATIQLDIDKLEVAAGLYHVSLGIYEKNWAYAFDRHVNAYDITVEGESGWSGYTPAHRWTID